jgi:hypothetical protein
MSAVPSFAAPESILRIANATDRRLAWEFFVFFSRFEYALKRNQRFLRPGTGDAEANWDRFASDFNAAFLALDQPPLHAAVDFYQASAPRKQLRSDGSMSWSEPQSWDKREPLLIWLLRVVRTVRNNLFHGGKFPLIPISDPSRDRDLLIHAIAILAACLRLDGLTERIFDEGIDE